MTTKYILDGHTPIPTDLIQWAQWFGRADRQVARDQVGDVRISTVFIGIDYSFGRGPPLLFETMIFGGSHDGYQDRCSAWEEAEAMHASAVKMVKSGTAL